MKQKITGMNVIAIVVVIALVTLVAVITYKFLASSEGLQQVRETISAPKTVRSLGDEINNKLKQIDTDKDFGNFDAPVEFGVDNPR